MTKLPYFITLGLLAGSITSTTALAENCNLKVDPQIRKIVEAVKRNRRTEKTVESIMAVSQPYARFNRYRLTLPMTERKYYEIIYDDKSGQYARQELETEAAKGKVLNISDGHIDEDDNLEIKIFDEIHPAKTITFRNSGLNGFLNLYCEGVADLDEEDEWSSPEGSYDPMSERPFFRQEQNKIIGIKAYNATVKDILKRLGKRN